MSRTASLSTRCSSRCYQRSRMITRLLAYCQEVDVIMASIYIGASMAIGSVRTKPWTFGHFTMISAPDPTL
ncbi:uncharacterized protein BDV14DRAFT_175932 [Aspergillus stella-maris]|uniref:uncharacterized protein n=1 Tax=Aspergillus stella-maris TaxID=1810926 RepID=UPI003CCD97B0